MTKMSEQNNSKKVLPKRKRKHSKRHTTGRGEGSLGYKQISKIISFDNQARNDKNNKIITIIYSFSFSYFDVIIFYIIFFPRCIVLMCSLFIFYIFPNGVFQQQFIFFMYIHFDILGYSLSFAFSALHSVVVVAVVALNVAHNHKLP